MRSFVDRVVVIGAKVLGHAFRLFRLGAGFTWPGEVALRLRPTILTEFSHQARTVVLIAGTNGKTTTAKMVETILTAAGMRVRRNTSGANLDNGLVSAFVKDATPFGSIRSDIFIFEVDEAVLPNILRQITPTIVVLLNLFRDQLDRYGEVDVIAEKWRRAFDSGLSREVLVPTQKKLEDQHIKKDQITYIINADDPHLGYIGSELRSPVRYFGLDNRSLYRKKMQHATDAIYCAKCGNRLKFGGLYYSHLGTWACESCGLRHASVEVSGRSFRSPIEGLYNHYNTLAAALVCRSLGLSDETIADGLMQFTPAFGRLETIEKNGKRVKILLSKNPAGYNESLRTVLESDQKGPLLLVLNDRIPDGRDVSWIWDVDFEVITDDEHMMKKHDEHMIIVSGDRCYDLALRLKYAGISMNRLMEVPDLKNALRQALDSTKIGETLWVLPTYSAMLEVRKLLIGRRIL
ncbi:MAG: Mur ligase family protein [bacterium]|nr:Mur ligase family protein [bacterium]